MLNELLYVDGLVIMSETMKDLANTKGMVSK